MIIVLKPSLAKKDEAAVIKKIRAIGYQPHIMRGVARTVIGAIGDELTHKSLEALSSQFPKFVESVLPIQKRYKLVSREAQSCQLDRKGRQTCHRRPEISCHGRAMFWGERETTAHYGRGGSESGRNYPARRRFQTLHCGSWS